MSVDDAGVLSGLVKVAGTLISAAIAIGLSWRGRTRWEPSEEDVPKGPQRVAGLLTAVALALIWSLLANREHLSLVVKTAIGLAIATFVFLLIYSFFIGTQTYIRIVDNEQVRIIGGFSLTTKAKQALKSNRLTTQEYLAKVQYDPDKVWTRVSRSGARNLFILCYTGLVVSGSIALACAAVVVLVNTGGAQVAVPREKSIVHIGIVLNGEVFYTREAMAAFTEEVEEALLPTGFSAHFEYVTGFPEISKERENLEIIEGLLSRFPETPDYLVTIGTQVSEVAYRNYFNRLPIIFIAVTDPVRSGLAKSYEPDPKRGRIGGVVYGIPTDRYLSFFATTFPGKRFGFLYNPDFNQDVAFKDEIISVASRLSPPLDVVAIEVTQPKLSSEQEATADIFFGRYYLMSRLTQFIANSSKPIVASDVSNLYKGAVATIASDSRELGALAADRILIPNLLNGVALAEIPILTPQRVITGINLKAARKYGISVTRSAVRSANVVVR